MVTRGACLRQVPTLLVAVVAFGLARAALLPGVAFWDTGELQTVGPLLGTAHPTGFPTYVLLGWLASVVLQPLGEPAFRMNLFNAICLAAAAGLTVDLVRALTRSIALGVLAGLGLALTPIAWAIGTHADAHALHLVFVALLLRLLLAWESRVRWEAAPGAGAGSRGRRAADLGDRYLVAATAVFGLALGTHSEVLLLAPAVGLFVRSVEPTIRERRALVATCAAALAIAVTLVYLELPLRAGPFRAPLVYGRPDTWDGFWYVALGQQFMGSLVDPFGDLPRKLADLAGLAAGQFGPLAVLIPFGLAATVRRRPRYALLTGVSAGVICFFAASYENADIGRYYLVPILIAWTWLAVLARAGGDWLATAPWPGSAPGARAQRLGGAVAVALGTVLLVPTFAVAPDRLAALDESGDHSAADWTDRALGTMEPNAVVVSWWSYSTPLWYAQRIEGRRPDLTIIDDRTRLDEGLGDITDVIDAYLGSRPVYVIRSDPDEVARLSARYRLEPVDGAVGFGLTRVTGRLGAGS